ncbi:MAG TPA: VTT domain-containing protein, partial [Chloroflexota bacterium]|nr:VTT domain-containing protein [Chloroflexota bacterium]
LARMREKYWILTLWLAVGGGLLLNWLLKLSYERARPRFDDPLLTLTTYSFPSGHTAGAVVFYGVLAAFLVSRFHQPWKRLACVTGAVVAVALVAFSRMYLGAHYLSDVLAAICSSTAWLVLCLASVHALVRRNAGERRYEPRLLEWHWIALGLALGAVVAAALLLPMRDWSAQLQGWLERTALVPAMLVFTAIYVAGAVLMMPAWIFPIVAGVVFGFAWGIAVTLVAATLAAVAPFLIARYLIHDSVERRARRNPVFKSVDDAVRKEPWKVVALIRMSPVLPSPAKSYFLGLTRVDAPTYAWASLLGMLPGLVLKVYVGSAGRELLADSDAGALKAALLAAGVAATIAVTVVMSRFAKRRLKLG